jgi:phage-related protein
MMQVGREPADFKPLPRVGPGAYGIRVRDEAGAFRVIYVAKFEDARVRAPRLPEEDSENVQADLEPAAARYKSIGAKA